LVEEGGEMNGKDRSDERWARLFLTGVLGFFGGAACYLVVRYFLLTAIDLYDEEVGPRLPWAILSGGGGSAMFLLAEWRRSFRPLKG
jgi:hypothetical protein